jgi:hypothetical protein
MSRSLSHSDYYRDRRSEYELCRDFPADNIFIDGLHSMQMHMWNNGVNLEIPVVRVMNTAHFLAAYMFATTCSGDQMEYDVLADMSLGRDKQMYKVAMIVLAAMLKRTGGFRASQCRNVILDNRDPDFEEGVTLYDRFLRSAETRFKEEDFLIDTHKQLQELIALNEQKDQEIATLKYTISTMEEKYTQYNIGTQNNNCTQIGTQNIYYVTPTSSTTATTTTEPAAPTPEQPQMELFKYIHPCVTDAEERRKIHLEIQNLVRSLPLPEICRYLRQMYREKRIYLNVKMEAMFDELHRMGMPDESVPGFSMKNFQDYFNIND